MEEGRKGVMGKGGKGGIEEKGKDAVVDGGRGWRVLLTSVDFFFPAPEGRLRTSPLPISVM